MAIDKADDASFSDKVLSAEPLVLVDFWAPWCGPCKAQDPVLQRLAKLHPDVEVVKVNVDESPQTAQSYGVRSIPMLALFDSGKVVLAKSGLQNLMALDGLVSAAKKKRA